MLNQGSNYCKIAQVLLVAASEPSSDVFQMVSLWSLATPTKSRSVWVIRMYVRRQKILSLAFMHSPVTCCDNEQGLHRRTENLFILCMEFIPEVLFYALKGARHKGSKPDTRVASHNTEGKHEQSSKAVRRNIFLALGDRSALQFENKIAVNLELEDRHKSTRR